MLKYRLNLAVVGALVLAAAAPCLGQEDKLLAVLKSNAGHKEKADACRLLSRIATKKAVPVLATMLGDEKLAHMARYALEPIPDPSVDVALRAAMGKLKGRRLVGVIGSLGVRRDAKAVGAMAKLLAASDAEVASAAARALGKIATPESAKALKGALTDGQEGVQLAICEGLFRCAEAAGKGQGDQATAIYDRLRTLPKAPHQVRTAALRGAVLTRGAEGLPLLLEALRGKDYGVFASGARISMELPGAAVTGALVGELARLPADRQILLIQTLGHRGDEAAGPALLARAKKGPEPVRVAAIRAVGRLGYGPAVATLTELSMSGEGELASEASRCLAGFGAKKGQDAILALLGHKDAKARLLAIELIGQRSQPAAPALLKAAEDPDATVRLAALKALRNQTTPKDLPVLLRLLTGAKTQADMQAAEGAVRALCARQSAPVSGTVVIIKALYGDLPAGRKADVTRKVARMVKGGTLAVEASNGNFGDPAQGTPKSLRVDYTINGIPGSKTVAESETITFTVAAVTPPAFVDAFCAAQAKAPAGVKPALLRLLRSAGGAKALKTVRAAASDSNAEVKDTALRALCDWPTADALPDVAELAKKPPSPTIKILALRGYIRLAVQQNSPAAKKLAALKAALDLAKRDEEKRLVLSALGNVPLPGSLALVTPFLDNRALKEEACLAAVAIAERIVHTHSRQVAQAMQQVAKTTRNRKLAARANALARRAGKR